MQDGKRRRKRRPLAYLIFGRHSPPAPAACAHPNLITASPPTSFPSTPASLQAPVRVTEQQANIKATGDVASPAARDDDDDEADYNEAVSAPRLSRFDLTYWPLTAGNNNLDGDNDNTTEATSLVCLLAPYLATTRSSASTPLPSFSDLWSRAMAPTTRRRVPATPRVISPSPDTSDHAGTPQTRSSARRRAAAADTSVRQGDDNSSDDPDLARARSRSREGDARRTRRRQSGAVAAPQPLTASSNSTLNGTTKQVANGTAAKAQPDPAKLLSPHPPSYWQRALSRSPSPLGLIPVHRTLRTFVHKHEIPRKFLHVSIGFLTLTLYARGYQTTDIHPVLLGLLVPIAVTDLVRHNVPAVNRLYIRLLGALMRESEAHDRYNGVIWYLLGAWAVLRVCPKDVGVVAVVLLSWCDTAASTIGRLYGRYTPQLRRGKSLAGTLAACVTGVVAASLFWGWWAPRYEMLGIADNSGSNAFAFQGTLTLPQTLVDVVDRSGLGQVGTFSLTGTAALATMGVVAGLVASAAEAVDLWGCDDNLTIPVLCGLGLWGFLRVFGAA